MNLRENIGCLLFALGIVGALIALTVAQGILAEIVGLLFFLALWLLDSSHPFAIIAGIVLLVATLIAIACAGAHAGSSGRRF